MKVSALYTFTNKLLELPRFASDGKVAIKPGFERIEALLDHMGRPEKTYQIALVAGTNGKGSTCSMMAACLTAAGYKTGLHTSPHLIHVSERMRVDGKTPSFEWLETATQTYFQAFIDVGASFFEATLALSLLWFADQKVTHAVVEVGLGGRLDATNTLDATVCVITGVALDHMDLLGQTIPDIAQEKAGIIKPNRPIVIGNLTCEAKARVEVVAQQRDAPFLIASDLVHTHVDSLHRTTFETKTHCYADINLELKGAHQVGNAATALCALEAWIGPLSSETVQTGLENISTLAGLRGRNQVVLNQPLMVVDVAHNPDAVRASLEAFEMHLAAVNADRPVLILGMLSDKDTQEVTRIVAEKQMETWTVSTYGARGLTSESLTKQARFAGISSVQTLVTVEKAIKKALSENRNCLVLGSHLVVSEALETLQSA